MAASSSFALQNRQNADAADVVRHCLRKEEPTKGWILSSDSLPPHAPAGLRVLYATTALELLAVLNCYVEMPDVLLHSPRQSRPGTRGNRLAVYHLVTPEFVCWVEDGLSRLGRVIFQEREAYARQIAAATGAAPDVAARLAADVSPLPGREHDLPGTQELKLWALQSQLDEGLQRRETLTAWQRQFMRPSPARMRDAERLVREHGWEPRRVSWPGRPDAPDVGYRGLCWEDVGGPFGWAVAVPDEDGEVVEAASYFAQVE